MRPSRIAGHLFILCFLWITLCAFLFTVVRHRVFLAFPHDLVVYSYAMIAPYQNAIAPHGQIHAECQNSSGTWVTADLAPFYPQMFGERNAREYFAMYSYFDDTLNTTQRMHIAQVLQRLLTEQGTDCSAVRLAWDKWPANEGSFDALHIPTFTDRLPLYGY